MLLKRRTPRIDTRPPNTAKGFEHLDDRWLAVVRWLNANRVDYVLVGAAAEAVRGRAGAAGPVAIVPSPYHRNFERLARALTSNHARIRLGKKLDGEVETGPAKITAEKLARGHRWVLRCGSHDLDIEGRVPGVPRYQELLYEAGRFELAAEVSVEVASPEDIEAYAHARHTGAAPEFRVRRNEPVTRDG
jgi:hypothetical protein